MTQSRYIVNEAAPCLVSAARLHLTYHKPGTDAEERACLVRKRCLSLARPAPSMGSISAGFQGPLLQPPSSSHAGYGEKGTWFGAVDSGHDLMQHLRVWEGAASWPLGMERSLLFQQLAQKSHRATELGASMS